MKAKGVFGVLERISELLARITLNIVTILTGAMVITVLIGVVYRYVLGSPLGWTEELARYLMIWAALLAVSVCIHSKEHVRLQIGVQYLPVRLGQVVAFLVNLGIIVFLVVLTQRGYQMALKSQIQTSLALGISMMWPLMSIPVSGAFALVQQVLHTVLSLKPDVTKEELFGETEVAEALKEVEQMMDSTTGERSETL